MLLQVLMLFQSQSTRELANAIQAGSYMARSSATMSHPTEAHEVPAKASMSSGIVPKYSRMALNRLVYDPPACGEDP